MAQLSHVYIMLLLAGQDHSMHSTDSCYIHLICSFSYSYCVASVSRRSLHLLQLQCAADTSEVGVKLILNAHFGIIHSTVLLVSVYCCSMANGLPTHTYKLYNSMYMLQLYCIVLYNYFNSMINVHHARRH